MDVPMGGVTGSCVQLCLAIAGLLEVSKHNKEECKALHKVTMNIGVFLEELQFSKISSQVEGVLRDVEAALLTARKLLDPSTKTGALKSLLLARWSREEFLRANRDLCNAFNILCQGTLLKVSVTQMRELEEIRSGLSRCGATFFVREDAACSRLQDIAEVGRKDCYPLQLLQQRLRDELEHVEGVAGLSPEELVEELKDLQMWIAERNRMARRAGQSSSSGASGGGLGQVDKPKKGMDEGLEEFLVEQVLWLRQRIPLAYLSCTGIQSQLPWYSC